MVSSAFRLVRIILCYHALVDRQACRKMYTFWGRVYTIHVIDLKAMIKFIFCKSTSLKQYFASVIFLGKASDMIRRHLKIE